MVEANQLNNPYLKSKIINYVVTRQNEDGGYCFAQGAFESNGQDTYYGLAILRQLDAAFPNPEKTSRFLEENHMDTIYSFYYTAKTQLLLNGEIKPSLKNDIDQLLSSEKIFGSKNYFSESPHFATTLMALELAGLLDKPVNASEIAEWLLSYENEDGGFGPKGHSNIDSTYHAVASLRLLNKTPTKPADTLRFVRACEKPLGGFTVIPMNFMPYMEYTYYGMLTLELLGQKSMYPTQTTAWVLSCQNNTGGFARSDLGIATFADTYYAVKVLQKTST